MRLSGKSAIITGGGTGIGRATAILFAQEGAHVIIAGRRVEPLAETVAFIRSQNGLADYVPADVSTREDVLRVIATAMKICGRIDILFNNAAIFESVGKTIVELSEEEWDKTISVNLKSVFLMSKYVIPHMIESGGGSIVNCSSISGKIGQRRQGAYNAAKGGIEMLTKCMALDFAPNHIRANTVCPAWVEIEFNKEDLKNRKEEIINLHPIGRVGKPEDVAYAVLYLASDESSWVTGTSLMVDGGYTAQ
jgi:NAD(P)-dependent dehydrogenase (short-subunit alcohol dehydrogenase family)